MARNERPVRRTNPGGGVVWLARWTDRHGKRHVGMKPDIKGTHHLKRDAQEAILACYKREDEGPARPDTVGGYAASWTRQHPRSKVTNRTNDYRIASVLDVEVEGTPLRAWPFGLLRRRHATALLDHLLRAQGRSYAGAANVMTTLHTMAEDAIGDEVIVANPFKVKLRRSDPRIRKQARPIRVWSWMQMHEFARACATAEGPGGPTMVAWRAQYAEAMVRVLSDCGLRAGELLALERRDLDARDGLLRVERTMALGEVLSGTKTDHGEQGGGRVVPVPSGLAVLLRAMPPRLDTPLLFPTPLGRPWGYANWWKLVWRPGVAASGLDMRPHEARHSWVSLMRAAGVDPADLADAAGHSESTATARYSHGLGRSFEAIRKAVGE
jgi:integrase